MTKVVNKIFLLFVLMLSLFKQLFLTMALFSLSSIKKYPKMVAISIGIILAALCAVVPSVFTNNSSQASINPVASLANNAEVNVVEKGQNRFGSESNTLYNSAKANINHKEANTLEESLKQTFAEVDGIAFQATHLAGNTYVGRSEPFAPLVGGMDTSSSSSSSTTESIGQPLTPEETAIIKAEEKRARIKNVLNNNIAVKGIVVDATNKKPLAVVEITQPDGSSEIKTVLPGETLYFADCLAKVTAISQNKISLKSEGIKVDRFIPDFNDDVVTSTSNQTSAPAQAAAVSPEQGKGNLVAPPAPQNNLSGQSRAATGTTQQKIQEIDKLLNKI